MNSNTGPDWAPSPYFSREWLVANGLGGYASCSVAGAVTRRYHAFLCAAPQNPQARFVLVSKIEESLEVGDQTFDLSANFWPNTIAPRGDCFIESFELDPFPRWVFQIATDKGTLKLEKVVWMPDEQNATVARYRILSGPDATLNIRPFVTGRDYHSTHHANPDFNTEVEVFKGGARLKPYDHISPIYFGFAGQFCQNGHWFFNFQWPIERERGLDFQEDAWNPGVFYQDLKKGKEIFFSAAIEPTSLKRLSTTLKQALERRQSLVADNDFGAPENRLKLAADQFLVKRPDGLFTILAGYPWFTDWGRDTMIALPGLCLSTGRFEIAAGVLRAFAGAMSQGMIPNRFPEAGEAPDYNTVDGTLWFFHAVAQYGAQSGDWETVRELYPKLSESVGWHLNGTRFGIMADPEDGLLRAGDANSQLTWMDAKIGQTAFTPRWGKPVEIQALWFNALSEMVSLARRFGDDDMAHICLEWSRKVAANFAPQFWNEAENCLFDCINGDFKDGAIRPNQILAVSLPHRLLSSEQERGVLAAVETDLLTPHGLRSLSPRDSRFRGVYEGDQWSRDSAYHQGTVWAWPLGAFLEAHLNVHNHSNEAKTQVRAWLSPLIAHLDEAGVGSISEIFDGDAPFYPRGCFAQAWSVSEVLRLWILSAPSQTP